MDQTETKELVESMYTIICQLMNNEISQAQVLSEFSEKEFKVLRKNLFDENPQLRKISILFMAILTYQSPENQVAFCNANGVIPSTQQICLNVFPNAFSKYIELFPEMFRQIKQLENNQCLFWYVTRGSMGNYEEKPELVAFFNPRDKYDLKYIDDFIPDPLNCLVGIFMTDNQNNYHLNTKGSFQQTQRQKSAETGRVRLPAKKIQHFSPAKPESQSSHSKQLNKNYVSNYSQEKVKVDNYLNENNKSQVSKQKNRSRSNSKDGTRNKQVKEQISMFKRMSTDLKGNNLAELQKQVRRQEEQQNRKKKMIGSMNKYRQSPNKPYADYSESNSDR